MEGVDGPCRLIKYQGLALRRRQAICFDLARSTRGSRPGRRNKTRRVPDCGDSGQPGVVHPDENDSQANLGVLGNMGSINFDVRLITNMPKTSRFLAAGPAIRCTIFSVGPGLPGGLVVCVRDV